MLSVPWAFGHRNSEMKVPACHSDPACALRSRASSPGAGEESAFVAMKKQIPLPRMRDRDDIVGPSSAAC
jgi:hypothetical protein